MILKKQKHFLKKLACKMDLKQLFGQTITNNVWIWLLLIQEALKQANIDVEIEVVEWGAYLDKTANGEHDMFILGLIQPCWRC